MDINDDMMLLHMLITQHMPDVLCKTCSDMEMNINIQKANEDSVKYYNEIFANTDSLTSLLTLVLILKHIYSSLESQGTIPTATQEIVESTKIIDYLKSYT